MAPWAQAAGYITFILGYWILRFEEKRERYIEGGPTLYTASPYRSGRWRDGAFVEMLLVGGVVAGIVVLGPLLGGSTGLTVGPFLISPGFVTGLAQFAILGAIVAFFALYQRVRRIPGRSSGDHVEFRGGGIWWPGAHIPWRSIDRWSLFEKDGADELLLHQKGAFHRSHALKLAPGQERDIAPIMREMVGAEPTPRAIEVHT
jgi:hypothetical protein